MQRIRIGTADDARDAEAAGQTERAIAAWRRAIEAAPTDPEAYESLGRLQLRGGDASGAVATYRLLLERAPAYPRGRYRLAYALRKAGQYREAAEAYRTYTASTPDDPDAWYGLGETQKQLGDQAGAIEAYREYVRRERRPSEAKWVARANDEIKRLEASAVVEPGHERPSEPAPGATPAQAGAPQARAAAGSAPGEDFAAGGYSKARAGYERQLVERPDSVAVHYRTAVAAALAGEPRGAERHAAETARLDPGNPAARDLALMARARRDGDHPPPPPARAEAELALREGRFRTAERLAAEALGAARSPAERGSLQWLRGRALLGLRRPDEALRALKTAAGLGHTPPELWLDLGDAAWHQGDRRGAKYYFTLAAGALAPDHPLLKRARARLGEVDGPAPKSQDGP